MENAKNIIQMVIFYLMVNIFMVKKMEEEKNIMKKVKYLKEII